MLKIECCCLSREICLSVALKSIIFQSMLFSDCRFMEVTREELYLFLQKSGAGSMEAVRAATQKLTALVSADKAFASFYMWNFHYYRSAQEESKKFIPVATAGQVRCARVAA